MRLGVVFLVIASHVAAGEDLGPLLRGLPVSSQDTVQAPRAPSPGLSFLLSALVPGAGQVSQGRRVGWGFVAADCALWGAYVAMRGEGHDAQRAAYRYADAHFVLTNPDFAHDGERGWYEWWDFFRTIDPRNIWADTLYWHDIRESSTHDRTKYYEDIGASNAYVFGWDDWAPNPFGNEEFWWQDAEGLHFSYVSPHRDEYRRKKARADLWLRRAGRMVGIAVLARAATAVEALRAARVARGTGQGGAGGLTVSVDWRRSDPAVVVAWRRAIR